MAVFSEKQVIEAMTHTGLVPLFTHDDVKVTIEVLDACYQEGIRAFEFTNRRSNSLVVFTELASYVRKYPDMMLGVGTVLDADTAKKFIAVGAHFIISPIMKPEMAEVCAAHHLPWIPGCFSLTEIVTARDHGAGLMKVFPGSVLGPAFVSAVMPVVPDLKLMITGGVELTEESLSSWFNAGAACVGLGSQLISRQDLESGNWVSFRKRIREAISIIRRIRNDRSKS